MRRHGEVQVKLEYMEKGEPSPCESAYCGYEDERIALLEAENTALKARDAVLTETLRNARIWLFWGGPYDNPTRHGGSGNCKRDVVEQIDSVLPQTDAEKEAENGFA